MLTIFYWVVVLLLSSCTKDLLSLVSSKKLRVIKKASFDDTLITWPNQLLCPSQRDCVN